MVLYHFGRPEDVLVNPMNVPHTVAQWQARRDRCNTEVAERYSFVFSRNVR
jgi:hypothetical protein